MTRQTATLNDTDAALRTPRVALTALVVAACSVLFPPLGILAVVLGALAHRRCRHSLRGGSFAASAVALGSATSAITAGVVLWLAGPADASRRAVSAQAQAVHMPRASVGPGDLLPGIPSDPSPEDEAIRASRIGELLVVDVGPKIRSLTETLDEQRLEARAEHRKLVLLTVIPDCAPCGRIAEELDDPRVQRALSDVRLVRVNAVDFVVELAHLNVPTDAFPGFSILGADGRAIDHVHGGEWDDDVAANIAPVLESFVGGTYTERRAPWRGGPREDETSI